MFRNPSSRCAQGQIEMWVDILTPDEASKKPVCSTVDCRCLFVYVCVNDFKFLNFLVAFLDGCHYSSSCTKTKKKMFHLLFKSIQFLTKKFHGLICTATRFRIASRRWGENEERNFHFFVHFILIFFFRQNTTVWNAKEVMFRDTSNLMNDCFVSGRLRAHEAQTTDTHWRSGANVTWPFAFFK